MKAVLATSSSRLLMLFSRNISTSFQFSPLPLPTCAIRTHTNTNISFQSISVWLHDLRILVSLYFIGRTYLSPYRPFQELFLSGFSCQVSVKKLTLWWLEVPASQHREICYLFLAMDNRHPLLVVNFYFKRQQSETVLPPQAIISPFQPKTSQELRMLSRSLSVY